MWKKVTGRIKPPQILQGIANTGETLEGLRGGAWLYKEKTPRSCKPQNSGDELAGNKGQESERHSWKAPGGEFSHGMGCGGQVNTYTQGWKSQRRESQRVRGGREDCPIVCWAVGGCQPAGMGHLLSAPSPPPAQISCWCLGVVGI